MDEQGQTAEPGDRFVNPYSFVPLPDQVEKREPLGHDPGPAKAAERFCGSITVRWRTLTPLLLPRGDAVYDYRIPQIVRIPGASIKGAVRSLHETMFRGCLRVLDPDFVPVHREPVRSLGDGWELAVVEAALAGRPLRVRLCSDTVWVNASGLQQAYEELEPPHGLPRSGDALVNLSGTSVVRHGRDELPNVGIEGVRRPPRDPMFVRKWLTANEGSNMLLVAGAGARQGGIGHWYWATGRITTECRTVPSPVVDDFARLCEGAEDRRKLRQRRPDGSRPTDVGQKGTQYKAVGRNDDQVGERALATGFLHVGDVVWVRADHSKVDELRLSVVWRHLGEGSIGERLPHDSLAPCQDPKDLCLSCSVFGAAEDKGGNSGIGEQNSYAAHVRFDSAETTSGVKIERIPQLAPLMAPRPGAGLFYLQNPRPLTDSTEGDVASHWGSAVDLDAPRQIAGRKFYWHSDPVAQQKYWSRELGRAVVSRHEGRGSGDAAAVIPAGTELTCRITVDGLDRSSVASLLVALQPSRWLAEGREYAQRLGGGKPLGLGSVVTVAVSTDLSTLRHRYLGSERGDLSWGLAWSDVRTLAERIGLAQPDDSDADVRRAVRQSREPIEVMLDVDGLRGRQNLVWYPPGAGWDKLGEKDFDLSYQFFAQNSGQQLSNNRRPWIPLPPVEAEDPSLPIPSPPPPRKRR